ncbi:hypothetical protein FB45DRAFT_155506 [Roridomyces roridus]|uniref:Uncharacterized protein n=1 Tax=Roridomyces roridus TaxID=1738132 RepID=A0AAD7BF63_9AGAR|nr:hypothetical protein FB45DRAFT_430994 [Roridomyces roridus]KAJ7619284.1 hypothetical protein FB45DRAFT_155506 [Roridomyces roridus]
MLVEAIERVPQLDERVVQQTVLRLKAPKSETRQNIKTKSTARRSAGDSRTATTSTANFNCTANTKTLGSSFTSEPLPKANAEAEESSLATEVSMLLPPMLQLPPDVTFNAGLDWDSNLTDFTDPSPISCGDGVSNLAFTPESQSCTLPTGYHPVDDSNPYYASMSTHLWLRPIPHKPSQKREFEEESSPFHSERPRKASKRADE